MPINCFPRTLFVININDSFCRVLFSILFPPHPQIHIATTFLHHACRYPPPPYPCQVHRCAIIPPATQAIAQHSSHRRLASTPCRNPSKYIRQRPSRLKSMGLASAPPNHPAKRTRPNPKRLARVNHERIHNNHRSPLEAPLRLPGQRFPTQERCLIHTPHGFSGQGRPRGQQRGIAEPGSLAPATEIHGRTLEDP